MGAAQGRSIPRPKHQSSATDVATSLEYLSRWKRENRRPTRSSCTAGRDRARRARRPEGAGRRFEPRPGRSACGLAARPGELVVGQKRRHMDGVGVKRAHRGISAARPCLNWRSKRRSAARRPRPRANARPAGERIRAWPGRGRPAGGRPSRHSRSSRGIISSTQLMALPYISSGGSVDPDVVVERRAHLLQAVGAVDERRRQHHLRLDGRRRSGCRGRPAGCTPGRCRRARRRPGSRPSRSPA